MTTLDLWLLGGFEARIGRGDASSRILFPTRKCEALVAYLAIRPEIRHRRDHLCEFLWGDVPRTQARHSLRQTMTDVRAALGPVGPNFLQTSEDTVSLTRDLVRVDVQRFDRLLDRRTPRTVAAACALYRGEFLEGVSIREAEFESWAGAERTRCRQRAIDAFETRLRWLSDAKQPMEAIQAALRLIALDPLQEWVHRALMILYWERGQLASALAQYKLCEHLLARDLGIAPDAETTRLWRELLVSHARSPAVPIERAADRTAPGAAPGTKKDARSERLSAREGMPHAAVKKIRGRKAKKRP